MLKEKMPQLHLMHSTMDFEKRFIYLNTKFNVGVDYNSHVCLS